MPLFGFFGLYELVQVKNVLAKFTDAAAVRYLSNKKHIALVYVLARRPRLNKNRYYANVDKNVDSSYSVLGCVVHEAKYHTLRIHSDLKRMESPGHSANPFLTRFCRRYYSFQVLMFDFYMHRDQLTQRQETNGQNTVSRVIT